MPVTHSFNRPQLGDIFVRRNLNGNEEEAMVLSVQYHPKGVMWQATMNTKNGVEFVTGDAEHRNVHDWRPKAGSTTSRTATGTRPSRRRSSTRSAPWRRPRRP